MVFIFILILCAGLLNGCGSNPPSGEPAAETTGGATVSEAKTLKLPYLKTEPLNPFQATGAVNRQLSSLIYDCLFRVDGSYRALPVIAADYFTGELTVTVNIKTGLTFSDGSSLGTGDVVYSFEKARISPAFSEHLSNFASAKKIDEDSILFNLNSPDPFAVNCLDFSIIPENSEDDTPAGSGRYIFSDNNGEPELQANPARLGGFSPAISRISLVNLPGSDSMFYSLQIGNINFFFMDLSDGGYKGIQASVLDVGMNNMVYMAFNSVSENLQNEAVRQAISLLIDRESITGSAFLGHARAAFMPFNPAWGESPDAAAATDAIETAISLLELAGFSSINKDGIRVSGSKNALTLKLVVHSGNEFKTKTAELIAEQLKAAGIKVTVVKLAYDDYTAAVAAGSYDIYLGEVMLTPNMSLSPLLGSGGKVSFGINTATGAASMAYNGFMNGVLDMKGFTDAFNKDMPFVPICYRNGIAAYSRDLAVPEECNAGDVFCDIGGWTF